MARDILIVDDEADIRSLIAGILQDEGYETRMAADSDGALREIEARRPNAVILDIWLQGSKLDGLEILDRIIRDHANVPVIMISGHGNIETAVAAIKRGAYDYIEKPFKSDRLLLVVERALEQARLKRENEDLRQRSGAGLDIIGQSPAIVALRQAIERVAPTNSRVLISGPPGSGKELVARQLHQRSRRAGGPWVTLSVAAMSPEQMEQQLFGIEEAVNGQRHHKIGVLEEAHGGTLFLDEVGEMPPELQGKLLRVLQEGQFERVGEERTRKVDVRVIAATNRDLKQEVRLGRFREDLYFRLNVVPIESVALRERREDIPLLAQHFLQGANRKLKTDHLRLTEGDVRRLMQYDWPGNVRELENVIERAAILARDGRLRIVLPESSSAPQDHAAPVSDQTRPALLTEEERRARDRANIIAALQACNGKIFGPGGAAELLDVKPTTLASRIKALNIRVERQPRRQAGRQQAG